MALLPMYRSRLFSDPSTWLLDDPWYFFDPWLDFDLFRFPTPLTTGFRWIQEPIRTNYSSSTTTTTSRSRSLTWTSSNPTATATEKFRVEFNADGFRPETIKTYIENGKLIVQARQEDRQSSDDYALREVRKAYELPANADALRLASYVTPNNNLVIEVPLRNSFSETPRLLTEYRRTSSSSVTKPQRRYEVTLDMNGFQPGEVNVTVRYNQLIVRAERRYFDGNRSERSAFYKSLTLPAGLQLDQLQSHMNDDGQLKIEAPYAI